MDGLDGYLHTWLKSYCFPKFLERTQTFDIQNQIIQPCNHRETGITISCKKKKQSLHCLPFDPNIRTAWMKFIFNDVPDCVNKTLFVCSLHFTADSFLNKIQFIAGFSETLKIKDDAVPTTLDPAVMLQHTSMSNIFFYYVSLLLCLLQIR